MPIREGTASAPEATTQFSNDNYRVSKRWSNLCSRFRIEVGARSNNNGPDRRTKAQWFAGMGR
jgi:hypothetical protein